MTSCPGFPSKVVDSGGLFYVPCGPSLAKHRRRRSICGSVRNRAMPLKAHVASLRGQGCFSDSFQSGMVPSVASSQPPESAWPSFACLCSVSEPMPAPQRLFKGLR